MKYLKRFIYSAKGILSSCCSLRKLYNNLYLFPPESLCSLRGDLRPVSVQILHSFDFFIIQRKPVTQLIKTVQIWGHAAEFQHLTLQQTIKAITSMFSNYTITDCEIMNKHSVKFGMALAATKWQATPMSGKRISSFQPLIPDQKTHVHV